MYWKGREGHPSHPMRETQISYWPVAWAVPSAQGHLIEKKKKGTQILEPETSPKEARRTGNEKSQQRVGIRKGATSQGRSPSWGQRYQ